MQNDLISRSDLLKVLKEWADNNNSMREYDTAYDVVMDCISTVENQPTAYDEEKVIDKVDDFEIRCCDCQESCNTEGCLIERIKNVIRNGGKE